MAASVVALALLVHASPPAARPWSTHTYLWRSPHAGGEYRIRYATAGCGPPVVLCHGFGGSIGYWRELVPALANAGLKVYALDLLGFGDSEKPVDAEYSTELWAQLLTDFTREYAQQPAVLIGNSLGSLISLKAAASDTSGLVRAVAILNCAGGINSKCMLADDTRPAWLLAIARTVFSLIDAALSTPSLRAWLFETYSSEDNVRQILQSVYVNGERVDDELVTAIIEPAADPNAPQVFANILTSPPGLRPDEVVPDVDVPILAIWGDRDNFTPLSDPVGRMFTRLAADQTADVQLSVIRAGHVPHDDAPEQVLEALLPWTLQQLGVNAGDAK